MPAIDPPSGIARGSTSLPIFSSWCCDFGRRLHSVFCFSSMLHVIFDLVHCIRLLHTTSLKLSVCLSVSLFLCFSVSLSLCLCVSVSLSLSACLPMQVVKQGEGTIDEVATFSLFRQLVDERQEMYCPSERTPSPLLNLTRLLCCLHCPLL